ncbi:MULTISPECIES: PilN domain-containing protein [Aliiglaciecola]|uniref:PilN domain-containing protein n=1 Tax=Aliiglaciecola TaxID=1406885 RepID=UPI001C0952AB|nr:MULTISPECIES: PilN domain-containing protein [Aliiglaciecola]MBU2880214.1 PilN domain-containing protein [Aliiglaciecola lipolytica]MDO6713228.1 PilN domain-containing protein [Aliiglaciecola sp. 2_MG-2023]MDO6754334.1 PilN domain-containing protein [Aliiglaciecola sp. 1_MG-2023]
MKTRINFFREDLKFKIILLNLNFLLGLAILSIICIVTAWLWASNSHANAEQQTDLLLAQIAQKKELSKSLIEAKDTRTQSAAIVADVEKHQQELAMKRTILNELDSRQTQRSNGFSSLMVDLAKNHHTNLWLTNILLNERSLYIEGATTDSKALPQWVSQLNQASYFADTEFAGTRMFRNDKQQLQFILSSNLDDMKGKGQ